MTTITNITTSFAGRIFCWFPKRLASGLLAVVLLISAAPSAHAQTYYLGPDSGNWSAPANWGPFSGPASGGIPVAGNDVILGVFNPGRGGEGPITVTLDYNYTSTNVLNSLTLDAQNCQSIALVQNDSAYNMYAATEVIGNAYTGAEYDQSGATNNVGGTLTLGQDTNSGGAYNLSGIGFLNTGAEIIGDAGTGNFTQSGRTINTITNLLDVGEDSTSTGTYNFSGVGSLTAGSETIGDAGTGTLNQSDGSSNTLSGGLTLGNTRTGTGTYNLSGTSTLSAGFETVGNHGIGIFTQSGNSTNTILAGSGPDAGILYVGLGLGLSNSGTYNLGDSATLTASNEIIGDFVSGTFNQNGTSSNTISGNLTLVAGGAYNLEGGSLSADSETIGQEGIGTVTQTGNSANGSRVAPVTLLDVGSGPIGTGTYNLGSGSDAPTINANVEIIGDAGNGTFTQQSGTNTIAGPGSIPNPSGAGPAIRFGSLIVGNQGGQPGVAQFAQYNLEGGVLYAAIEDVGYGNSATNLDQAEFNQTGTSANGTSVAPVTVLDVGYQPGSVGTYELGSGSDAPTLNAQLEIIDDAGNGTFTQQSGTNTTQELYLGIHQGSTAEYYLKGGTLNAADEYVGYGKSATNLDSADFNQTYFNGTSYGPPATNTVALLDVGFSAGSVGTYELSGDVNSTLSASVEIIGDAGTGGTFTQTGGINTISSGSFYFPNPSGGPAITFGTLIVGNQGGQSGYLPQVAQYNLQGGALNAATEYVGYGNSATNLDIADFNQTGNSANGTILLPVGLLDVGALPGSVGTYELGSGSDAPTLNAYSEIIGDAGNGTFTQQSGTNTTGDLYLGSQQGSTAEYYLKGGTLTASNEDVGYGNSAGDPDSADFDQTGGANGTLANPVGLIDVGYGMGSVGTYELANAATINAQLEFIGDAGNGTFTQSGSSSNTVRSLLLGLNLGSTAEYDLYGGTLTAGIEYVGQSNSQSNGDIADFNQTDFNGTSFGPPATNNVSLLEVGFAPGGVGTYELGGDANSTINAHVEVIGEVGSATFTQTGGINTMSGSGAAEDEYSGNPIPFGTLIVGNQGGGYAYSPAQGGEYVIVPQAAQYSLQGGALNAATEYVGYGNSQLNGDSADFNQSDFNGTSFGPPATNTVDMLDVGYQPGSVGTYELSGDANSTLTSYLEIIGDQGNGTFTQTGGVNTIPTGSLEMGNQLGSTAEYYLQGGTLNATNEFVGFRNSLANGDAADFNQTDFNGTSYGPPATNIVGVLDVGFGAGSVGTYELSGDANSTLTARYETIGDAGNGAFTQTGSSVNGSGFPVTRLDVGGQATGVGAYYLGTGSDTPTLNANIEIIGDAGSGTFTQQSGTNTIAGPSTLPNPNSGYPNIAPGTLIVGNQGGQPGIAQFAQYNLQGGTLSAATEYVGYGNSLANGDSADFNQTGSSANGTLANPVGLIDVAANWGSVGTYELGTGTDSPTINAVNEIIGDYGGTGTFTQNSGTNAISGNLTVGNQVGSHAEYTMNGGTLTVAGAEYVGFGNDNPFGDTADFTQNDSDGPSTNNVGLLDLGSYSTSVGTYELSGGTDSTLNANGEVIGDGGNGTFIQTGGVNTISQIINPDSTVATLTSTSGATFTTGTLIVGNQGGSPDYPQLAQYNLQGGTLNAATEYVGYGNSATFLWANPDQAEFNQTDINSPSATNNVGILDVAYNPGSVGTYELDGDANSTLNAQLEIIGDQGNGTFTQTGGVNTITLSPPYSFTIGAQNFETGSLYLANQTGSTGAYNLEGGTLQASEEYVGYEGNGTFTQSSGTTNETGNLEVGGHAGATGEYYLEGGTLTAGGEFVGTGNNEGADFDQTGGANNVQLLDMTFGPGSVGTYELSGAASTLNAEVEVIGDQGNATFTQSGGTNTISRGLYMGYNNGSAGEYYLQGGALMVSGTEYVGYYNSIFLTNSEAADITQTGGTNGTLANPVGLLDLAYYGPATGLVSTFGTYELSGATSTIYATNETIGDQGSGTFSQSGGSTNTINDALIVGNQSGSIGTYNMSSGAQLQTDTAAVAASPGSTGSISVDGSGTHFEANMLSVGGSASVAGGTGSFTLTNGSTAHVAVKVSTGTNGTIDVADNGGGGLTIGSTSTLAANGTVQVNSGGFLGGSGEVIGNVVNGGTVAPGDPTTFTINGNYTQISAGVLALVIAGPNASDGDHLDVNGMFAADLGATLQLSFTSGFLPTTGETFDLIDYESIDPLNSDFTNVEIEGLAPGFDYSLNPNANGGTEYQLTALNNGMSISDVPEPSTYALILVGLGLLAFWRTRTRQTLN